MQQTSLDWRPQQANIILCRPESVFGTSKVTDRHHTTTTQPTRSITTFTFQRWQIIPSFHSSASYLPPLYIHCSNPLVHGSPNLRERAHFYALNFVIGVMPSHQRNKDNNVAHTVPFTRVQQHQHQPLHIHVLPTTTKWWVMALSSLCSINKHDLCYHLGGWTRPAEGTIRHLTQSRAVQYPIQGLSMARAQCSAGFLGCYFWPATQHTPGHIRFFSIFYGCGVRHRPKGSPVQHITSVPNHLKSLLVNSWLAFTFNQLFSLSVLATYGLCWALHTPRYDAGGNIGVGAALFVNISHPHVIHYTFIADSCLFLPLVFHILMAQDMDTQSVSPHGMTASSHSTHAHVTAHDYSPTHTYTSCSWMQGSY